MNRKKSKGFDEPVRTCIGCRRVRPKRGLLRIAYKDGVLKADGTEKSAGRGVYICRSAECLEKALKTRAFNRGFRTNLDQENLEEVAETLRNMIAEQPRGESDGVQ